MVNPYTRQGWGYRAYNRLPLYKKSILREVNSAVDVVIDSSAKTATDALPYCPINRRWAAQLSRAAIYSVGVPDRPGIRQRLRSELESYRMITLSYGNQDDCVFVNTQVRGIRGAPTGNPGFRSVKNMGPTHAPDGVGMNGKPPAFCVKQDSESAESFSRSSQGTGSRRSGRCLGSSGPLTFR
jgi:hypothetical protein